MAPGPIASIIATLPRGADVLDPMMGSGTVPLLASLNGCHAVGVDSDPLAVLLASVLVNPLDNRRFLASASEVVARAVSPNANDRLPVNDAATAQYIDYWFDEFARRRLARLANAILAGDYDAAVLSALWIAFSRLIVTKDSGASLARDVSHSRPHRVRDLAVLNPLVSFEGAARTVLRRHTALREDRPSAHARTMPGDARHLDLVDASFDAVITSPPYLSAIDYLRGHRLSLVWMGHTIPDLRRLRSSSIGTELSGEFDCSVEEFLNERELKLRSRDAGQVARWVADLRKVSHEARRVLRTRGRLTMVVGRATLGGARLPLPDLMISIAESSGFQLTDQRAHVIPSRRRYLPPPSSGASRSALDRRVKEESVLSFVAC